MNISTKRKRLDDIRPLTLAGFAGNVGIVKKITSQLISGLLSTILMFSGPTGVGKTTMCRAIARSMMCKYRRPGSAEPCGKCRTCTTTLDDFLRIAEYEEVGADQLNNKWLQQLSLDSLNPDFIYYIDELQDADHRYIKCLRKIVESSHATFIFSTTHLDSIEDAFRNRFRAFEYELTIPDPVEVIDFLEQQFREQGVTFSDRKQLARMAKHYQYQMRPCAQLSQKILGEADGNLTDAYLDDLCGPVVPTGNQPTGKSGQRRPVI